MLLVDRIATRWYVTRNATTKAVRVVLTGSPARGVGPPAREPRLR
jgi:hypothetical protein